MTENNTPESKDSQGTERDRTGNQSGYYPPVDGKPGEGTAGQNFGETREDLAADGAEQRTTKFPTTAGGPQERSGSGTGSQAYQASPAPAPAPSPTPGTGQAYPQQGGYQTQQAGYQQQGAYPGGQYPGVQQQARQPYPQQGGGYPQYAQQPARAQEPSFFKALFDMNFTHFVTERFVKVIYLLPIILGVLVGLSYVVMGFLVMLAGAAADNYSSTYGSATAGGTAFGVFTGLLMIVIGLFGVLIHIILTRVVLEFFIASIRTAKNTGTLVEQQKR